MLKLRLPKLVALGAFALGVFSTAYADITPLRTGPVSQYGQLMAGTNNSGQGRIYGSCAAYSTSGNEVQVKGMSLFWSQDPAYNRYWKKDVITGEVSRQGIQIIRAAMAVDLQRWGDGHYFMNGKTEYYQDLLDEAIQAAIENDIYVIIDYHSHIAAENVNRAKEFFKIQAKKWGAYDNVIFEIFNEPLCKPGHGAWADISGNMCNEYGGMITWSEIKAYAEEVIPVIRRYSDNLIVVGTPQWSARPGDVVGSAIDDPNVAYTLHFYAGFTDDGATSGYNTTNADNAISHGLSVFVTEWGTIGYDGAGTIGDPVNHSDAQNVSWQTWMNANKLSSANWNLGYNDTPNGETAAEYFTVNFDADDPATATWTYSASGQWVNTNVFAGLTAINYTQCASYVDLPDIITGNDGPDGEFGDVYEDEVINHDYVIVDFDMNNLGGGSYFYVYSNMDVPTGEWTISNGVDKKTFFVDGSNAGGVVGVNANGGSGWAGLGIYVKEMKGCEVLSFKYKGLANDFSFNVVGGSALIQESLSSTESWMTWSISLDGIDPTVLESPIELKWQVSGSPDGEDLYIDDVQCGDPASGSNDPPVEPQEFLVDDFEGNGYAGWQMNGYDYLFTDGSWTVANDWYHPDWSEDPNYQERYKTTDDPEQGTVGALLNVVSADEGNAGIGDHVLQMEGCAVLQYKYKGLAHTLAFMNRNDKDGSTNYMEVESFDGVDVWTTVSYVMEGAVSGGLDLSSELDIQWRVIGPADGENLLIDDVECVKAPGQRICDAEYCEYSLTSQFDFAYAGGGWTIENEDKPEGGVAGHFYDANDDKTYVGLLNTAATVAGGWAGAGINVNNLNQCRVLSYMYKGYAHDLTFENEPANGDPSYGKSVSASDSWREVTFDLNNLTGIDLGSSLNIRWQKSGTGNGTLYIDDVKCVLPASSSSSTSSSSSSSDVVEAYLVEDFNWGGRTEYKYVFADTWTIANSMSHPVWSQNPDYMEYDVTTRDPEQGIVGAVLQVSRVGEEDGGAGIGVHVSNLSGCAALQYKYKGLEHNLAFFNNQESVIYAERFNRADNGWMTVTYDMNRAIAEGLDIDAALEIQWHVLEPDGETDLLVDDVKCLQPANSSSSSGDEPASSSSNVLPDAAAPTTYAALFDDFEDGDMFPLWSVGNYWAESDRGDNGGNTTAQLDVVPGNGGKVLQLTYAYDVGKYAYNPFATISTNDFGNLNLSQCSAIQYDYKGSAHKFRIKVSENVNNLLEMGWGFHTYTVDHPSATWQTVSIPLASLRQEWGKEVPIEIAMQYANGFDWRVEAEDRMSTETGTLSIDNIRCIGLAETRYYTVTFKNGEETLLEKSWAEGSNTYDPGLTPVRAPDPQFTYTFTGWTPSLLDMYWEPVKVTANAAYQAEFDSEIRTYTVTFLMDDGETEYATANAEYDTPVQDILPENPAKDATDEYTYTFNSWSPSVTDAVVTGDMFYVASFGATKKQYSIAFVDVDDETVLKAATLYDYGTPFDEIDAPTVSDNGGWRFAGWTPNPATVTEDVTYRATYTQKFIITWKDDDGSVLRYDYHDAGETPDYGEDPTKPATAQYSYDFTGWTPAVTDVTGDAVYTATYSVAVSAYEVAFMDDQGEEIIATSSYPYGTQVQTIAPNLSAGNTVWSTAGESCLFTGWNPVILGEAVVTGDKTYTAQCTVVPNKYSITFVMDDGTTPVATVTRDYGTLINDMLPDEPTKTATNAKTFEFARWVTLDGQSIAEDAELEGNTTLKAVFNEFDRMYAVAFVDYDNTVLKPATFYTYGATVEVPDDPTRDAAGIYTYEFRDWNPAVTTVTGEAIYKATYDSTAHYGAIAVSVIDGKKTATIDGSYTDGDVVNIPNSIEIDTVVFNRTFSASGYSTITLPFSINRSAIEGVSKVLTFTGIGYDENGKKQVEMEEVTGELSAYKPYMVELTSEGGLVFHGNSIEIQPTEGANTVVQSDDGWEFRGTLSKIVWDEKHPDLGRVYGFSAKEANNVRIGQFVKAGKGAWINPFRAYMIYNEGNSAGKSAGHAYVSAEPLPDYMDVVVVSRGATGEESKTVIGGINTRTGEFKMMQDYDLKGRKLNGKPTARGVYYGKKKIIK
ncbi:MAG: CIA30 family protein [Fibrobacter sp.]|nr:CIA30 family protein [Fibrobacter sp.]